jgi:hypothetical protein
MLAFTRSHAATWLLCATLPFTSGCGHEHTHDHGHGHGHVHVAPRGGVLIELGDHQANLELILEPASGTLRAYSLDAHAENPVRLTHDRLVIDGHAADRAFELELLPVASELTGETAGDTSEFAGRHDALVGVQSFEGTLRNIVTRGLTFEGVALSYQHPEGL